MEVVFPETNINNNAVPMVKSKKRRLAAYNNVPKRQKNGLCCVVKEKPKIIEEIIRHNTIKERLEAIYHRFYY